MSEDNGLSFFDYVVALPDGEIVFLRQPLYSNSVNESAVKKSPVSL